MSKSVYLAWIKPALRALMDPNQPNLPQMTPVQITEIVVGSATPSTTSASSSTSSDHHFHAGMSRCLLSDKVHTMWSWMTTHAIHRFESLFPEFRGRDNLHKLCGGIILPTQYRLQLHENLHEFILWIDEFDYKGGAGNNEFAAPVFHPADAEIQQIIHRHRTIDVTPLIDRSRLNDNSAAGGTGSHLPFTDAVRTKLQQLQTDPINHQMELDAIISADQQAHLNSIQLGLKSNVPQPPTDDHSSSTAGAASAAQMAPFTFSQLDSFPIGGSESNYASQDFGEIHDRPAYDAFSQLSKPTHGTTSHALSSAAAAAATTSATTAATSATAPVLPPSTAAAASVPVFSSTHRFLAKNAQAERAAANPNQAFVAAFGHVAHVTPTIIQPPTKPTTNPPTNSSVQPPSLSLSPKRSTAAAAAPPPSLPALSPARRRGRSGATLSPVASIQASQSPARSVGSRSPARLSSPLRASQMDLEPGAAVSQTSHHNLMPDSLDDLRAGSPLPPQPSLPPNSASNSPAKSTPASNKDDMLADVDEDEEVDYTEQETGFPFLTQAHSGGFDDDGDDEESNEDGPQPMELDSQDASAKPINHSASSIHISPTPTPPQTKSPVSTGKAKKSDPMVPSPTAATSTVYASSSIEQRQAERRRQMEARLAEAKAAEEAKRQALLAAQAEVERKRQQVEEERNVQLMAAAAAAIKEQQARQQQEEEEAERVKREAQQASKPNITSTTTTTTGISHAFTQSLDDDDDDDICILAASLTESPNKKPRLDYQTKSPATTTARVPTVPSHQQNLLSNTLGHTTSLVHRKRRVTNSANPLSPSIQDRVLQAIAMETNKTRPAPTTTKPITRYQPLKLTFGPIPAAASATAPPPPPKETGEIVSTVKEKLSSNQDILPVPPAPSSSTTISPRSKSTPPHSTTAAVTVSPVASPSRSHATPSSSTPKRPPMVPCSTSIASLYSSTSTTPLIIPTRQVQAELKYFHAKKQQRASSATGATSTSSTSTNSTRPSATKRTALMRAKDLVRATTPTHSSTRMEIDADTDERKEGEPEQPTYSQWY